MRAARRGNAAVEFAFWMAGFLVVLVGTVDVAHFLNTYIIVQRAARDGARQGATVLEDPPATGVSIESQAVDAAELALDSAGLSDGGRIIAAEWTEVGASSWLDVTVEYPVRSLTNLFPYPMTEVTARFSLMTQQRHP